MSLLAAIVGQPASAINCVAPGARVASGGAITNAVYDAVRVQINAAPITAERVYEVLQVKRTQSGSLG